LLLASGDQASARHFGTILLFSHYGEYTMSEIPADFDEQDALARSARGDSRAFKFIFDAYQSRVYTFALHYLKSDQQAEEAVQEVFLKLWRKGSDLAGIGDLQQYIFIIARNHALDCLRRNKVREKLHTPLPAAEEPFTNNTEEAILLRDTRRILEEGIARLPPQQQRVYQLCHQQGLTYSQAAQKLAISEQTVHRHMKLALRFLRDYLNKHGVSGVLLLLLKLF